MITAGENWYILCYKWDLWKLKIGNPRQVLARKLKNPLLRANFKISIIYIVPPESVAEPHGKPCIYEMACTVKLRYHVEGLGNFHNLVLWWKYKAIYTIIGKSYLYSKKLSQGFPQGEGFANRGGEAIFMRTMGLLFKNNRLLFSIVILAISGEG